MLAICKGKDNAVAPAERADKKSPNVKKPEIRSPKKRPRPSRDPEWKSKLKDADLLRYLPNGDRLADEHVWTEEFTKTWSDTAVADDLFLNSRRLAKGAAIDTFISYCWSSPTDEKAALFRLRNNTYAAAFAMIFTSTFGCLLWFLIFGAGKAAYILGWFTIAGATALAVTVYLRGANVPGIRYAYDLLGKTLGRETFWLDRFCVYQGVGGNAHVLREKGVSQFALVLGRSRRVAVLWHNDTTHTDSNYMRRVWCVYELATFMRPRLDYIGYKDEDLARADKKREQELMFKQRTLAQMMQNYEYLSRLPDKQNEAKEQRQLAEKVRTEIENGMAKIHATLDVHSNSEIGCKGCKRAPINVYNMANVKRLSWWMPWLFIFSGIFLAVAMAGTFQDGKREKRKGHYGILLLVCFVFLLTAFVIGMTVRFFACCGRVLRLGKLIDLILRREQKLFDVRECLATRPEDKKYVLGEIAKDWNSDKEANDGINEFNEFVQKALPKLTLGGEDKLKLKMINALTMNMVGCLVFVGAVYAFHP